MRPGAERVDETSRYCIASITKVFTVLGYSSSMPQGMSLEDTVGKYAPQLRSSHHHKIESTSSSQWDKISLRSLASQLSGLPRGWVQGEVLTDPDAVDRTTKCDSHNSRIPCTEQELLDNCKEVGLVCAEHEIDVFQPCIRAPRASVSDVSGTTYEEYIITSVLNPSGMSQTSFSKPPDRVSVLPKGNAWYFDVDKGVENPTGGLYSSSKDMPTSLRYILGNYKDLADAKLNWLLPVSFIAGIGSFYGMPWEIYRTDKILLPDDKRRAGQ